MDPRFFVTPEVFRAWLEAHHEEADLLWVGFHKKGSGRPSITWPEAVDEALCFGWIDGVRRSLDGDSYVIRFTPRRDGSKWSLRNVRRVEALTREGRMQPAGLAAYEGRKTSGVYSYEARREAKLDAAYEARFRAEPQAWAYFQAQPPWYRRTAVFWVMSAKREATRERRLATLIADSAAGRPIAPLTRPQGRGKG